MDEVKAIENITPERVNEIFAGISDINLPSSFTDGYDFAVVSGVREDRTVVVFTGKNGKFEDHVLSVDGKENMTNEEILAAIKSGTGFSKTTRTIDPSKKYEAPALEEKPVDETITIGEIFDKNFSNINFSADVESAFQNIYSRRFSGYQVNTLFYAQEDNNAVVYVNIMSNRDGRTSLYKLSFNSEVDLVHVNENLKEKILKQVGYSSSEKVDKSEGDAVKENIQNVIEDIKSQISTVGELQNQQVKREGLLNNTADEIDKPAFGAKLCKGKEVIATYVGAMSSRINDSAGMFNTGYYTTFETSVVYKENDQIIIKKDKIYVPYYNNSTNESLYNTFLSDTDGTKHNIESISTEVVNNPVIATENGKKAEYNISFESDDPQLASIASSAISQWLKNEEDSISR